MYNGSKLLDVQKPETLERKYMGKISRTGIEFMKKLLQLDPKKRIKGVKVLEDPYFKGVFKKEDVKFLSNVNNENNVDDNNCGSRNNNDKKKDFMRSLSNKIIHDYVPNNNNINHIDNNNNINTTREKKQNVKNSINLKPFKISDDKKENMNNTTTNINIINYNLINTSINSNNFSLNNLNNLQQSNNNYNNNINNNINHNINNNINNIDIKNSPKNIMNNKFSISFFHQKEKSKKKSNENSKNKNKINNNNNNNKEKDKIFKKMAIFGKEKFTFRLYETQVSHKGFRVHYHSIIMFVVNHYVYVDF